VTMTLVFSSICLKTENIAFIATVYWLLDSCCTVINVMGNMTVGALIDSRKEISQNKVAE
jgi:Na+/H+-dicarboxylate symporter